MKEDARNMNDQPDRFELFTLEDGEEKVTMEYDSRIPNTAIFYFAREDHTLGNLLAAALLQSEHVLFAAYKVPHPLFPHFTLRVSTSPETGPREALENACRRVIQDLQNMAKQFTREWEIWKLTNEAAAGREDEEKIEREKKMAEARKERDRVRAEMIREEVAERSLWDNTGLGEAAWDNGGGGGEASPQWGGGNGNGSPGWVAPWDEPLGSDAGDSAPWDRPIGDGGSYGGVSPAWDGGLRANSGNGSGRAPWGEPSGNTSPQWNSGSYSPNVRSPTYEPPNSGGNQSYGGSPSRAPWDVPAGGRSPTYEPPGGGQGRQASSFSRAPWGEPEQAAASASGEALWDKPAGGNDNPYTSELCSPPPFLSTAPLDVPTGEPQIGRVPTASNDTVGGGRGRVAAHELHTFSASSVRGQNSDADNELLYRDPNSEGEQAYLRRVAAGFEAGAPTASGSNRGAWGQGGKNNENRSGGNENNSNEDGGGNDNDTEYGGSSPPWSGGYGGSSPAADSGNRAPWEDY